MWLKRESNERRDKRRRSQLKNRKRLRECDWMYDVYTGLKCSPSFFQWIFSVASPVNRVKRSLAIVETAARRLAMPYAFLAESTYPCAKVHRENALDRSLFSQAPALWNAFLFKWLLVSRNILNAWPASSFPCGPTSTSASLLMFTNFGGWWHR